MRSNVNCASSSSAPLKAAGVEERVARYRATYKTVPGTGAGCIRSLVQLYADAALPGIISLHCTRTAQQRIVLSQTSTSMNSSVTGRCALRFVSVFFSLARCYAAVSSKAHFHCQSVFYLPELVCVTLGHLITSSKAGSCIGLKGV